MPGAFVRKRAAGEAERLPVEALWSPVAGPQALHDGRGAVPRKREHRARCAAADEQGEQPPKGRGDGQVDFPVDPPRAARRLRSSGVGSKKFTGAASAGSPVVTFGNESIVKLIEVSIVTAERPQLAVPCPMSPMRLSNAMRMLESNDTITNWRGASTGCRQRG